MKTTRTLIAAAIALAASQTALAIDVDAGDYTALPAGTNLFLSYYQYATRDAVYTQGARAPGQPKLESHLGIVRGVKYVDVGGYIVGPEVLLPFGRLRARGDISALGSNSAAGDIILGLPVWFSRPDAKAHVGVTPYLILPTGQYDRNDPLSLGENRWRFILQAGGAQPLTDALTVDIAADVQYHGRNTDFGPKSQLLKQKPLYEVQGFLRYRVAPGADLRVGLQHLRGGENAIDGLSQGDRQKLTKAQVGGSLFISPRQQVLATYGRDLSVRTGFKEDHRLNLRFLQVF